MELFVRLAAVGLCRKRQERTSAPEDGDALNASSAYCHCKEQKRISNTQSNWREEELARAKLILSFL